MTAQTDTEPVRREPLTRDRVLAAAVALADEAGIEAVSMRKLGSELGVEAMSLYNHVANKEDILDGMVDRIVGEIDIPSAGPDWKQSFRSHVLAAREVMRAHPWAPGVIESRNQITPPMAAYMDSIVGLFADAGFSMDLTHHAMHTLGSRMLGFTQELFDDSGDDAKTPEEAALLIQQMKQTLPNIGRMLEEISHDEDSIIGLGCDDDVEFIFSLDLILDGLERARDAE